MQSDQQSLTKFMLRNTVPGDSRLKFSYTARPQEFLQLLVDNMNVRDEEPGWSFGSDCVESLEKVLSFNHNTCAEALQMIAEVFETEWEVKGKTIYLRNVEYNKENPLPLSYGESNGFLPGLGRSEYSDVKPVQRLFVQGSDRNIDPEKYRKSNWLALDRSFFRVVDDAVIIPAHLVIGERAASNGSGPSMAPGALLPPQDARPDTPTGPGARYSFPRSRRSKA